MSVASTSDASNDRSAEDDTGVHANERCCQTVAMTDTLHWSNADVEVHKVVVGPYENNVFVVRCRASGEAVLLDAANEHEQLLELCQRLGVKRVLETHGHWDHIQAVPACARRATRSPSPRSTPPS